MRALGLLRWFCKKEYLTDIEGDLIEMYEKRVNEKGLRRANLLLWRDVILLFRPGMIKSLSIEYRNPLGVAQHNILITIRTFWRNKTAFYINLCGLSIGLACVLLIYAWIADEVSFDRFHEKSERIYLVRAGYTSSTGIRTINYTPALLAEAMATELPEVETAVAMNPFVDIFGGPGIVAYNKKEVLAQGMFADDNFFRVFSFTKLLGRQSWCDDLEKSCKEAVHQRRERDW